MNVRTVTPSPENKPTLRMNVLKVIEEHAPLRLAEIDKEVTQLLKQMDELTQERARIERIIEAAK